MDWWRKERKQPMQKRNEQNTAVRQIFCFRMEGYYAAAGRGEPGRWVNDEQSERNQGLQYNHGIRKTSPWWCILWMYADGKAEEYMRSALFERSSLYRSASLSASNRHRIHSSRSARWSFWEPIIYGSLSAAALAWTESCREWDCTAWKIYRSGGQNPVTGAFLILTLPMEICGMMFRMGKELLLIKFYSIISAAEESNMI